MSKPAAGPGAAAGRRALDGRRATWALLILLAFVSTAGSAPPPIRAEVAAYLKKLPWPAFEPRIDWNWDPTAFDRLAHPTKGDFGWRFAELRKSRLPEVARARLNLELAFLNESARGSGRVDMTGAYAPDSLGGEARAREALTLYDRLLVKSPGHGEFLTDRGDLYRLLGAPDSAIVSYRLAAASSRTPPRLFGRLANAELEILSGDPSAGAATRLHDVLAAGARFFAAPAPVDTLLAARFQFERGRFRADRAVLEVAADRALTPERWRTAGIDSTFALMARVVSPDTRRAFQQAAELDTNLAEAFGMLGEVVTGQIELPLVAEGMLRRETAPSRDSLAVTLGRLLAERQKKRSNDAAYAAANLNRCEALEPARWPRVRAEQARLALLFGDHDGSAGLWRGVMSRDPAGVEEYAAQLYTVHALEPGAGRPDALPIAGRMETAVSGAVENGLNPRALAILGILRGQLGRLDEAERDLTHAAALDSTVWRARLGLAVMSLRQLDTAAAAPHLDWVGRHFGDLDDIGRGVYCGAVALLLSARGDQAGAARWFSDSRRFDPLDPVLQEAAATLTGPMRQ